MSEKLKYGCVGAGGIADSKHLDGYSRIGSVEITAICDPNIKAAENLARKYNIPHVFSDHIDMFRSTKLDFISICTPNCLHAPITIEALQNGIHVHCEKPIALNAEEALAMIDARDKYGKVLMVGLNNRYTNEAYFAKKYIEEGHLGEIYHAKCGWRRRRGIPGKGSWFTNKRLSGGGALIDLGVHFLDLAVFLMGNPKPLSVTGSISSKFFSNNSRNATNYGSCGDGTCDVEDFAAGFIRLDSGATINFEFSWASNIEKRHNYYEILGTKGGISFVDDRLKIYSEIIDTCIDILPDTSYASTALDEFEHFIDCVKNGTKPYSSPEQSVNVMKIIDGIYKSSNLNQEVII